MSLTRLPDWRARLADYLETVARAPFRPGRHDCALFVAGGIRAMTGHDPAAAFRGRYRTLAEGHALLEAEGLDLVALAESLLPEVPPIMAWPGDVAILRDQAGAPAFGLVQGALIYVLHPGEAGLGLAPLTQAERAFRV